MKSFRLKECLVAASFAALASLPLSGQAAQISSLFIPGENTIQDTDAERILDSTGVVKTTGEFVVGDVVQAILRWDTVNTNTIGDTLAAPYQFTAYAELEVVQILDGGGSGGFDRVIFGATGNLGANVLVQLYERTTALIPGFSLSVDTGTGISRVTGMTLVSSLGLNGIDDFWFTELPNLANQIDIVAGATSGSPQAANGQFGLTQLSGDLPLVVNGIASGTTGTLHDVVGSSSIYALETGANSGWLVSSNTEASFNVIPEPGSLALLGISLAGLAGMSRRRSLTK